MKTQRVGFLMATWLGAALGCGGELTEPIDRVAYMPNGDLVEFSSPIRIFDPTLRQRGSIPTPGPLDTFQRWSDLSGDGTVAAVVHSNGTTTKADIFQVPGGRPLATFVIEDVNTSEASATLSPRGDLLFLNEMNPPDPNDPSSHPDPAFGVRSTTDGTHLWSRLTTLSSPVFSSDGSTIFGIRALVPGTGGFNYDVALTAIDAVTGDVKFAISAGGSMAAIALDPQGQSIIGILDTCISRGCWEYIASWSIADGTLISKVEVPAGMTFRSNRAFTIACATTQDVCASAFYDGVQNGTALWKTDGTLLRIILAATAGDSGTRPVFSPDGQFVVIAGTNAVVYRVDDGSAVARLPRTTSRN